MFIDNLYAWCNKNINILIYLLNILTYYVIKIF